MVKNCRVVLVGMKGCGKSTIISKLLFGDCPQMFVSSDEDIHMALIDTDRGTKEKVRLLEVNLDPSTSLDIKQQIEFFKHYWTCEAFILVVDVTNDESLRFAESVKLAIEKAKEKKEAVFVLIANKIDLASERKIDSAELQRWAAKEKVKLVEVSAFDRDALVPHFCQLISKLVQPQINTGSAMYSQNLATGSFRRSFKFISELLPFQSRRPVTAIDVVGNTGEKTWIGKSGKSASQQDSSITSSK